MEWKNDIDMRYWIEEGYTFIPIRYKLYNTLYTYSFCVDVESSVFALKIACESWKSFFSRQENA